MTVWRVQGFGGMVPALDERLLPDEAALYAENCLIKTGSISPLPAPQTLHDLQPDSSFAYRFPSSYADAAFLYDSTYLEFDDPDTTVVRAPVHDDQFDRYYFVSPQEPCKYNTRDRIDAALPPFLLGIPNPLTAPIVNSVAGTDPQTETRSYLYTWVSAYEEEGPPSPATTDNNTIDATWTITAFLPPGGDRGLDRNLTKLRIYRTVTTTEATASFYLVTEIAIPIMPAMDVTFVDTLDDVDVASKQILESDSWSGPPTDLHGFMLAPNGFLVGWRGNQFSEIWFSEPFQPHAWPAQYTLTVEYPIVGLGITNANIVCCTESYPVTLQGVHPEAMTVDKLVNHEPCSSRGSILSGPEGVFYVSPNGLILVTPGLAANITKDIISKKSWQRLLNVPRLRAARLGMSYFAYGSIQIGVFQPDAFQNNAFATEDLAGALVGVMIDPTSDKVAFSMLRSETPIDNCYNDPWSGEVFLITDHKVKWIDLVSEGGIEYQTLIWRSKIWQTPIVQNPSACKVYWDTKFGESGSTIRFYATLDGLMDETLVLERGLAVPGELIRLPSGYMANYVRFEIEGKSRIHTVQFATSVKELAGA